MHRLQSKKLFIYIFILFIIIFAILFTKSRLYTNRYLHNNSTKITKNATYTSSPSNRTILPGEQIWKNGISSYVFGVNDTNLWDGSNNIETNTEVQQLTKQAHFPLI